MKTDAQHYVDALDRRHEARRIRYETLAYTDETPRGFERNLGRIALWYARRGVAVFPCEYRGKRPLTNNGFKDATADEAQIVEWWTHRPEANIGTPTGLTFDVIDVDGRDAVRALWFTDDPPAKKMPPRIGHALTARTAGHHIYIKPTGRGNTTNLYPGVDYRGAGGYVILPPSIGANGRAYQWVHPLEGLSK